MAIARRSGVMPTVTPYWAMMSEISARGIRTEASGTATSARMPAVRFKIRTPGTTLATAASAMAASEIRRTPGMRLGSIRKPVLAKKTPMNNAVTGVMWRLTPRTVFRARNDATCKEGADERRQAEQRECETHQQSERNGGHDRAARRHRVRRLQHPGKCVATHEDQKRGESEDSEESRDKGQRSDRRGRGESHGDRHQEQGEDVVDEDRGGDEVRSAHVP